MLPRGLVVLDRDPEMQVCHCDDAQDGAVDPHADASEAFLRLSSAESRSRDRPRFVDQFHAAGSLDRVTSTNDLLAAMSLV